MAKITNIPDAALAKLSGVAQYRMATAGAEITIGGDHPILVKPDVRATKWGGECWLRVSHVDCGNMRPQDRHIESQENGKAVVDLPVSAKGRTHRIKEGSLKWEIIYDNAFALPADGIERFALEFTEGLTWHHQPELTAEEIAEGCIRPDNVVNSYAAYLGQDKFGHLYRAEMVDANGDRCWATQQIVDGEIQVTLPAEWLATADYPVTLDPTFGFNSQGASSDPIYNGYIHAFEVDAPASDGTVTQLSAYLSYFGSTVPDVATAGIYTDSSGPGSLIANGTTNELSSTADESGTYQIQHFTFATPPSVTGSTSYILAMMADNGGAEGTIACYIAYDAVAGYNRWYKSGQTYSGGSLPDPFPSTPSVTGSRKISTWATYTETSEQFTFNDDGGFSFQDDGGFIWGDTFDFIGDSAVTGSGAVAVVGKKTSADDIAVSGSAALTDVVFKGGVATSAVTAAEDVVAVHTGAHTGTADSSGTGAADVTPTSARTADSAVAGASSLATTVYKTGHSNPTVAADAADVVAAPGSSSHHGTPTVTGIAQAQVNAIPQHHGTTTVAGNGTVEAVYRQDLVGDTAVTGTADVQVVSTKDTTGTSDSSGTAAVAASPYKNATRSTTVAGTSSVAVIAYASSALSGSTLVSGTAQVQDTGSKQATEDPTVTGTAALADTGAKGGNSAPTVSGTGAVADSVSKNGISNPAVAGTGALTVAGTKFENPPGVGDSVITGTGSVEVVGKKKTVRVTTTSATDVATVVSHKGAIGAAGTSGTGAVVVISSGIESPSGQAAITGSGQVAATGLKDGQAAPDIRGSPALAAQGVKAVSGTPTVTGSAACSVSPGLNAAGLAASVRLLFVDGSPVVKFGTREIFTRFGTKGD